MAVPTRRRVAATVLAVLLAGGCVSRSGDRDAAAPATERTTAETTTTTASPTPSAADGADVTACQDGICEVLLTSRTVDVPTPAGLLSLTINDPLVEYTMTNPSGGTNSGSAAGNCVITLTLDGTGGGSTCQAGGDPMDLNPEPGTLALQILHPDTETPILRMAVA
jgi:hypothetical protein